MSDPNELRIYIVFRADLPEMTRAKGEVQAAHAVGTLIYKLAQLMPFSGKICDSLRDYFCPDMLGWRGQTKIAMEVKDEKALLDLQDRLVSWETPIPQALIRDEGRTCFPEPTFTCLAFGPCTKDQAKPYLDAVGAKLRK